MHGFTSAGEEKIFHPPTGISHAWRITIVGWVLERPPANVPAAPAAAARPPSVRNLLKPRRESWSARSISKDLSSRGFRSSVIVVCGLLAGEVAQLHSRMQHPKDVVESHHPDDVALGNHGHLADAVAAHPLQHGKN